MKTQTFNEESCPHASSCQLFPVLAASNALDYWTRAYCKGEFRRCARYSNLSEGLLVPLNLLPNGKKI